VKWVVDIYLTAHLNSIRCLDGLIYLVRLLISAIYSNKPSIPFCFAFKLDPFSLRFCKWEWRVSHKTISLCRHYPEEFWFVLVTRSAINHSHAWHSPPTTAHAICVSVCVCLALSFPLSFVLCVWGACPALMSSCSHIDIGQRLCFRGIFLCTFFQWPKRLIHFT